VPRGGPRRPEPRLQRTFEYVKVSGRHRDRHQRSGTRRASRTTRPAPSGRRSSRWTGYGRRQGSRRTTSSYGHTGRTSVDVYAIGARDGAARAASFDLFRRPEQRRDGYDVHRALDGQTAVGPTAASASPATATSGADGPSLVAATHPPANVRGHLALSGLIERLLPRDPLPRRRAQLGLPGRVGAPALRRPAGRGAEYKPPAQLTDSQLPGETSPSTRAADYIPAAPTLIVGSYARDAGHRRELVHAARGCCAHRRPGIAAPDPDRPAVSRTSKTGPRGRPHPLAGHVPKGAVPKRGLAMSKRRHKPQRSDAHQGRVAGPAWVIQGRPRLRRT